MTDNRETSEIAVDIFNEMRTMLAGKSTAAVYLAIGMLLGYMESFAKQPDRRNLLSILDEVMTDYRERQQPH